jgi:hypothetical protein
MEGFSSYVEICIDEWVRGRRIMGKLLLLWLHEAGPLDLAGRLAGHPPSLDAVLFLAAKEDLPAGVRGHLFELAHHLLVNHKHVVRCSTMWLGTYAANHDTSIYRVLHGYLLVTQGWVGCSAQHTAQALELGLIST